MNKILLTLSASFVVMSINTHVFANELNTTSWDFPTPEQALVSQSKLLLFCDANPSKCPVGLYNRRGLGGGAGGSGGLVNPSTNATANSISVVLAGDGSSVVLNTTQEADDNTISSQSDTDSTIDYEEVLNVTNN